MAIEAFVFDAYGTLYDVQSVLSVTEAEFPGHGELITQIWRLKQLEYTWLRSQMDDYRTFWEVSEESLRYTLDCVGVEYERGRFERIMEKYLHLDPYAETRAALESLASCKRAILSNGNQDMLDALVDNSDCRDLLDAVISVDRAGVFKPNRRAYDLIETALGVSPDRVVFVSSNAFDACGAKRHGLRVAWIERVTGDALKREIDEVSVVNPTLMFKLQRMRMEHLGHRPDHVLHSLEELPSLLQD